MEVVLRSLTLNSLPITLESGSTILGRDGILGIQDKRCSRHQATISIVGSDVTFTRHGVNPSFLKKGPIRESETDYVHGYSSLEKGTPVPLDDGDRFTLLVHEYPYVVRITRKPNQLPKPVAPVEVVSATKIAETAAIDTTKQQAAAAAPAETDEVVWSAEISGKKRKAGGRDTAAAPANKRRRLAKADSAAGDEWDEWTGGTNDDDDDDDDDDEFEPDDDEADESYDGPLDDDDDEDEEDQMYAYGSDVDSDAEIEDEDYDDDRRKRKATRTKKKPTKRPVDGKQRPTRKAAAKNNDKHDDASGSDSGKQLGPDGRELCKYGEKCYQANPVHIERVCCCQSMGLLLRAHAFDWLCSSTIHPRLLLPSHQLLLSPQPSHQQLLLPPQPSHQQLLLLLPSHQQLLLLLPPSHQQPLLPLLLLPPSHQQPLLPPQLSHLL